MSPLRKTLYGAPCKPVPTLEILKMHVGSCERWKQGVCLSLVPPFNVSWSLKPCVVKSKKTRTSLKPLSDKHQKETQEVTMEEEGYVSLNLCVRDSMPERWRLMTLSFPLLKGDGRGRITQQRWMQQRP
jgi:hypothetical protein